MSRSPLARQFSVFLVCAFVTAYSSKCLAVDAPRHTDEGWAQYERERQEQRARQEREHQERERREAQLLEAERRARETAAQQARERDAWKTKAQAANEKLQRNLAKIREENFNDNNSGKTSATRSFVSKNDDRDSEKPASISKRASSNAAQVDNRSYEEPAPSNNGLSSQNARVESRDFGALAPAMTDSRSGSVFQSLIGKDEPANTDPPSSDFKALIGPLPEKTAANDFPAFAQGQNPDLAAIEREIGNLQSGIDSRDASIKDWQTSIDFNTSKIEGLKQKIAAEPLRAPSYQEDIAAAEKIIAERNAQIAGANAAISDNRAAIEKQKLQWKDVEFEARRKSKSSE